MAEVMNLPVDSLEPRGDREEKSADDPQSPSPPPPPVPATSKQRSLMAPPPLRERQRNRDRDCKQRSSISPLPHPSRDRRHSPPRRSPPPPYKRSRREDGGYDGRRGGFGPSDRREGLMSYKQFIQELEDDILPPEAEHRYQEYKSEYISTQKQAYFSAHKDEGFKDKYHPTNLLDVVERRNELARKLTKDFLLDLQSGTLDMTPTSETGLSTAPEAHPVSSDPRRIQVDVEQAHDLFYRISKLDSEKQIEENILCGSDNDKMSWEKSHAGSTGPVIIVWGLTSVKGRRVLKKKLDSHWQERLQSQDPMEVMTAKEKDAAAVEALDPHVRKIRDEKYGCGAKSCTKLFHATEFVRKHLKLKHPELVMELTVKVREELYFQNYMNDADAPGGTPVMQQSGLRDGLKTRRFGADARLKDDCGNRRDQDNLASGSERFNNLQPCEFQSNNDGPDGGNLDNTMYDAFGRQGLRVVSLFYCSPLGPFVPAPPEVAMRMSREQGGPPPFEVGGRNSRSEPQLSGPAPMLALSPALQQDPRRLRSYQDLDAPEDEVTVIDYRSL
ncbi:hypothetical protein UlMin_012461 [Ulmus minor]